MLGLFHHTHIVQISGHNYRFKGKEQQVFYQPLKEQLIIGKDKSGSELNYR